jgi:hypothetical protein
MHLPKCFAELTAKDRNPEYDEYHMPAWSGTDLGRDLSKAVAIFRRGKCHWF